MYPYLGPSAGFKSVSILPNVKVLTSEYIYYHFDRFRVPLVSPALGLAFHLMPAAVQHRPFKIVASGITALARAGEPAEKRA